MRVRRGKVSGAANIYITYIDDADYCVQEKGVFIVTITEGEANNMRRYVLEIHFAHVSETFIESRNTFSCLGSSETFCSH